MSLVWRALCSPLPLAEKSSRYLKPLEEGKGGAHCNAPCWFSRAVQRSGGDYLDERQVDKGRLRDGFIRLPEHPFLEEQLALAVSSLGVFHLIQDVCYVPVLLQQQML